MFIPESLLNFFEIDITSILRRQSSDVNSRNLNQFLEKSAHFWDKRNRWKIKQSAEITQSILKLFEIYIHYLKKIVTHTKQPCESRKFK